MNLKNSSYFRKPNSLRKQFLREFFTYFFKVWQYFLPQGFLRKLKQKNIVMLKSSLLSFTSLEFKKPFTEKSSTPQYKNRQVFLANCTGIPGIVVTQYLYQGTSYYSFSKIQTSLNNAAKRIYTLLKDKGVVDISFALIPAVPAKQDLLFQELQGSYLKVPFNKNYDFLEPFLSSKSEDLFIENLTYEKPFLFVEGKRKFQLNRWKQRPGIYLIEEIIYASGKVASSEVVYVGKSDSVLWQRVRDKFYKNPHLFYEEIPGEKEYRVALVQVVQTARESEQSYKDRILAYEKKLISHLNPRDNKAGKVTDKTLEGLTWPGFKDSNDDLPF